MNNKILTLNECEKRISSLPYGSSAKTQLYKLISDIKHNIKESKNKYADKEYFKERNDILFGYLRSSIRQLKL